MTRGRRQPFTTGEVVNDFRTSWKVATNRQRPPKKFPPKKTDTKLIIFFSINNFHRSLTMSSFFSLINFLVLIRPGTTQALCGSFCSSFQSNSTRWLEEINFWPLHPLPRAQSPKVTFALVQESSDTISGSKSNEDVWIVGNFLLLFFLLTLQREFHHK